MCYRRKLFKLLQFCTMNTSVLPWQNQCVSEESNSAGALLYIQDSQTLKQHLNYMTSAIRS